MAIQVEKTKNSSNNFMFVFIVIFVIVIAIVFFSFRKSNVLEVTKIDIGKVINKDTKELDRIGQNLDRDIDLIVNNPKFYQLAPHNDVSLEFEVGRENPFQSF
jgi:Na+/melibiose symporter-like transporter